MLSLVDTGDPIHGEHRSRRSHLMRGWMLLLLILSACQSPTVSPHPTPIPTPLSRWGAVNVIAQTEQPHAPAMWSGTRQTVFAWIGSDSTGVHHDLRAFNGTTLGPITILPLDPIAPRDLLINGYEPGFVNLFWIDQEVISGENRLFGAQVSPMMSLTIGPNPLSIVPTSDFTVAHEWDNRTWVVWSGGSNVEIRLYTQVIDPQGRPRDPVLSVHGGEHPRLIRQPEGGLSLFWQKQGSREWLHAEFDQGTLQNRRAILQGPPLAPSDRLIRVEGAAVENTDYLFWNGIDHQGQAFTWYSIAQGDQPWTPPQRLGITFTDQMTYVTSYNGGAAYQATQGEMALSWVMPLTGQSDRLPIAAQVGEQLAIIYWQDGAIVAYQPIVTLTQPLIGLPSFTVDQERHLMLSWSHISDQGALLLLTTTR